ncbi:MAG TPA: glucosamine-6-phosphate deaminase [Limnochordia bacterium]|mgnify:FL=1|jgi:glucosamine-6-phosphate deaminase|nr:glucosamine-6-phosphate deaminase [Limnochordia bacterium]
MTVRELKVENIKVKIFPTKEELGLAAAQHAAEVIARLAPGRANVLFATGTSQFPLVEGLKKQNIDWQRVYGFHLDEYKGISPDHPASFRLWLRERIDQQFKPGAFHYIQGDAPDVEAECQRYAALLKENPIDVGFIGIGENGHIAFNDPPVADFQDKQAVKVVELDEACRKQQLGEGWFPTLDDVPREAVTLTIPTIMSCKTIISVVPEGRKAQAVRDALLGPIEHACPASILRTHPDVTLYLDQESASLFLRDFEA